MRALLLALLFTACSSSKPETFVGKPDEAATKPSGETPYVHKEQNEATEALQAQNEAKVLAANAQEATDADAAKSHKAVHDQLQRAFDLSDRRFNPLKEKVANATGAKRRSADRATAEVTKRETAVMASIAKLRDATGAEWDATKIQVEADTVALNTAIDALETTLQ